MTLTRWQVPQNFTLSPFRRVTNLRDEVDQLLGYAFGHLLGADATDAAAQSSTGCGPAVDLYETKDGITVRAELPGMKKEDIDIKLEEGFLTISGERKQDEKYQDGKSYRSERFLGRFQRAISLPSEVDAAQIKATYTDGILTVTLPKSEKARAKQIPVSVN